jgi:outer membrane protein TolC
MKAIGWTALLLAAAVVLSAAAGDQGEDLDAGKGQAAIVELTVPVVEPATAPAASATADAAAADMAADDEHPVYKLRPIPFSDTDAMEITLEELLDLAFSNNTGLKQQGLAIEKSHFTVDQTYYAYDPTLGASLSYSKQKGGSGTGTGSASDSYSASFDYTKPFEYGDSLRFNYDLGRSQISTAGVGGTRYSSGYSFSYTRPLARGAGKYIHRIPRFAASNSTQLAYSKLDDDSRKLKQSIIDTYYQAVAAREAISVREASIDRALKQLERDVERFKAGLAIEADVLQAENSVLSQRSALLTAKTSYAALLDQLTTLVSLPQEYKLTVDARGALIDLAAELPEDLWTLVETNSYELKSLNVALANLQLSRDQQLNQLRPDLGLSMSYGRTGADTGVGRAVTGLEDQSVQIGLNWSTKPGERNTKASIAQTDLDLASMELQIQDTKLKLTSAIRGLQRDLDTKRNQLSLAESNLEVLKKTMDITTERNVAGLATTLDVIQAQEGVLGGELALLQAKVAYQEAYRSLLVQAGLL